MLSLCRLPFILYRGGLHQCLCGIYVCLFVLFGFSHEWLESHKVSTQTTQMLVFIQAMKKHIIGEYFITYITFWSPNIFIPLYYYLMTHVLLQMTCKICFIHFEIHVTLLMRYRGNVKSLMEILLVRLITSPHFHNHIATLV